MIVEHVGGVSPDGTLSVFWWSPAHDWQALNVSSIAGGAVAGLEEASAYWRNPAAIVALMQ